MRLTWTKKLSDQLNLAHVARNCNQVFRQCYTNKKLIQSLKNHIYRQIKSSQCHFEATEFIIVATLTVFIYIQCESKKSPPPRGVLTFLISLTND